MRFPLLLILVVGVFLLPAPVLAQEGGPTPVPQPISPDRLAIPILPEHPSQIDLGLNVYYYHCMPCHGDRGQGLTEEWRSAWVEDHQNCWGRGCHAGRVGDEGFPIPRSIPAVAEGQGVLVNFPNPSDLEAYLRLTHPPQRPGVLSEDQYWAVTAYLLDRTGRLPAGKAPGSGTADPPVNAFQVLAAFLSLTLIVSYAIIRQARPR